MSARRMLPHLHFTGPAQYRLRSVAEVNQSILEVTLRRALKGPKRPGWNWIVELGTQILRRRVATAFKMHDVHEARRYLDSVELTLPALSEVTVAPSVDGKVRGKWFSPRNEMSGRTVLYIHGGGFSFYPRAYDNFIALIALATESRMFVPEYRLSPEYRFPVQLEDALAAYRWLLQARTDPDLLVIGGDSAGGNLAVALLVAVRELNLPLPSLAFALSPPTDFEITEFRNEEYDWIDSRMLLKWADWYCDPVERRNALVSSLHADLHGLPLIYLQAGRAEVLYDSIRRFADHARSQGANITLEAWDDMNHDFQMFGPYASQSADALRRLGKVITTHSKALEKSNAVST
jgi:epsilon-lactone hydrolase